MSLENKKIREFCLTSTRPYNGYYVDTPPHGTNNFWYDYQSKGFCYYDKKIDKTNFIEPDEIKCVYHELFPCSKHYITMNNVIENFTNNHLMFEYQRKKYTYCEVQHTVKDQELLNKLFYELDLNSPFYFRTDLIFLSSYTEKRINTAKILYKNKIYKIYRPAIDDIIERNKEFFKDQTKNTFEFRDIHTESLIAFVLENSEEIQIKN